MDFQSLWRKSHSIYSTSFWRVLLLDGGVGNNVPKVNLEGLAYAAQHGQRYGLAFSHFGKGMGGEVCSLPEVALAHVLVNQELPQLFI